MKRGEPPRRRKPLKRRGISRRGKPRTDPLPNLAKDATESETPRSAVPRKPKRKRGIPRTPPADRAAVASWRDTAMEEARGRCRACPRIIGALESGEFLSLYDPMPYQACAAEREALDIVRSCDGWATDVHHPEARGMGGHGDNDPDTNPGVACCHRSHMWLEAHPLVAEALGLRRRHGRPRKVAE